MPEFNPSELLDHDSVPGMPIRDSSGARVPLLAFVTDNETETALRGGLVNTMDGIVVRRGTILHAIRHLTKEPTPRVLVVDISGVSNPIDELEALARVCTPDVRVMVIGEESNAGIYRGLVRDMGVAEYIYKPVTRERVARLFAPRIAVIPGEPAAARGGSVVAVCGARGGVGTTTIAVNLALQLSTATRGHVALLDLHLQRGTAALMLDARPPGGLRIALEQPERADALFLDRVSVEINERLRLIAAEEPLDAAPAPTPDGMRSVLDLLRRRFNYIVMDLPVPATPTGRRALGAARHLLVVMEPDIAGLRDANRLRQLASGPGTMLTSIVLNRSGMPGGLSMAMIEQGLGSKPAFQIPDLGRQMGLAASLGRPALGECAAFRKAMALLAQEITGAPATQLLHAGARSFLGRMLGR